jgi:hypothetical protein
MHKGHGFKPEDGFTGSAHGSKDFRASVPGFKRGGHVMHPPHVSNITAPHTVMPDTSNDDEMSAPMGAPAMPSGGEGFRHGGRVEHDDHPKHDHVKYDKSGYQSHKKHKE